MSISVVNPLNWPPGWPQTPQHQRQRAAFQNQRRLTSEAALRGLENELRLLGAKTDTILVTCDAPLRADGMPRKARYYGDLLSMQPAVAVYFTLDGVEKCFPCDKWDRIEDNIRAVTLTIEALRGLEPWGSKHILDAAFSGFDALPAQSETGWWTVLQVPRDAPRADVERSYRHLVRHYHPDRGGNVEMFHVIQSAWDQFNVERGVS